MPAAEELWAVAADMHPVAREHNKILSEVKLGIQTDQ